MRIPGGRPGGWSGLELADTLAENNLHTTINAILGSFSLNTCRFWINDSLPKIIIQVQSGANYWIVVKLSLLHVYEYIIIPLCQIYTEAMFTLYRIGFCSVAKAAQVQCEQELMFCCGAEIVPKRSQCEQKPYPSHNLQHCLWFEKIIFQNEVPSVAIKFCSNKSVHTWFGLFQKPIRYGTFHFQQRSGAVLFRSRHCFESSVPGVNRSPIQYTFCGAPFH